ncbi:MAG: 50S ribosomal protein L4 [Patescibacteria group bacterium]|jgi:large subunit ribosomal protein L4
MKLNIYNQQGETKSEIEISDKVFGVKVNSVLINEAVVAQMANERQVLADTKGRSEVRGGGRKPWRQKGTGRARAGSSRSPIWVGGGVTFGPTKDRNFSKKINKQAKKKALLMVLSDRVASNSLLILDQVVLEGFKTKVFNEILNNLEEKVLKITTVDEKKKNKKVRSGKRSILFINEAKDKKINNSGRNLSGVKMLNIQNINIVDLLKYKTVITSEVAVKKLEEIYKK